MALHRLAYGRVSTDQQNIELQIAQFEALGYDELFVEKISGRRRDRPEFAKLISRAIELRQQGHDVQVLVIEWSRWARDTVYSLETLDKLERAGVQVLETTTGQPLTMRDSSGLVNAGLKALMAHGYSLDLSDRLKRSYAQRRRQGKPMAGPVPWGYQRNEGNTQLIPSEDWALCRAVVERYLEGDTLTDLIRWLYEQHGIKKSNLKRWLLNPALRGHIAYNGGEDLLYNQHQPLITEREYQAILKRTDENRRIWGANKGRFFAVPNSLVFCARCGSQVHSCHNQRRRYFYCWKARKRGDCDAPNRYCRDDWIEAAIQNEIAEAAEAIADHLHQPSADPRIAGWEAEITQLQPLAHYEAVAGQIEAIQQQIAQTKAATGKATAESLEKRQMIVDLGRALPEDWAMLAPEQRRAVYVELVSEVRILGAEVVGVRLGV
jgi:DNA invertase Pin-like site-specific DNA recombinase